MTFWNIYQISSNSNAYSSENNDKCYHRSNMKEPIKKLMCLIIFLNNLENNYAFANLRDHELKEYTLFVSFFCTQFLCSILYFIK